MYDVLDETNDYALDAPPVAFEAEEEDVIILQDIDENTDSEIITQVLEQAYADLNRVENHIALIEESIKNKAEQKGKLILIDAVKLREELERKYLGSHKPRFATEAFHYGYDVLVALEAENKEQKNIFIRIYDAIIKAFKILWNAITGHSKKKTPEPEEAIKETSETIKKAEEAGIKPDPDPAISANMGHLFPEYKTTITPSDVEKKLTSTLKAAELLNKSFDAFTYIAVGVRDMVAGVNNGKVETLKDIVNRIDEQIQAFRGKLPEYKKSDAKELGIEITGNVADESVRCIDGLLKNAIFVFWMEEKEGLSYPKSKFHAVNAKEDEKEAKFKVASSSEIERFRTTAEKLVAEVNHHKAGFLSSEDFIKFATEDSQKAASKLADQLNNDLNLSSEEKAGLKIAHKVLSGYLQNAGSVLSNMKSVSQLCENGLSFIIKYVELMEASYKTEKKEEKKEEKPEEKKS